jgi:3-oxoacyl-[acyl-carrier-protein] synthase-3
MRRYSRISGTGSYLPPRRLTNADLVAKLAKHGVETSDHWIVERTGIRARHFAAPGVFSSDLGLEAARNALTAAGVEAKDIDLIIVATSTPDMVFPSTACILQHKLGAAGWPAFDVQAVCSGFVYALTVADAMIQTGTPARPWSWAGSFFAHSRFQGPHYLRAVRRWCRRRGAGGVQTRPASWPAICMPMASMSTSSACLAMFRAAKVWEIPLLKMDGQAVFKLAVGCA